MSPAISGKVITLEEHNFDHTIKSEQLVAVDFWAEWCAPCRAMEPILDKLARKYMDRVMFAKVDVDKSRQLAERFAITAVPVLKLFKDGELRMDIAGRRDEEYLEQILDGFAA